MARKFVVTSSIADLSAEPEELFPKDYAHHPLRLSQLLFNEKLHLIEEKGNWMKCQALEQMHFTVQKGWHPYEGWVKKSDVLEVEEFLQENHVVCAPFMAIFPNNMCLSFGTYLLSDGQGHLILPSKEKASCDPKALRPLGLKLNRKQLIEDAKIFQGTPYLWGGRAAHLANAISSVDCSGLVNLLYRAQGFRIPRDAHPQFLFSKTTIRSLPGDPIYLSKDKKVTHVILKLSEDTYIESPESGKKVRLLKWNEDLWEDNGKWHFKDRPTSYFAYFRQPL